MQRMKQLTGGAILLLLTSGVAAAEDEQQSKDQQGGRSSEPAVRTGSGAHGEPSRGRQTASDTAQPKDAADLNVPSQSGSQSMGATGQRGWAANLTKAQIQELQSALAERGLYRGAVDGMAGPQTLSALRSFQEQQGFPTDQGVDPRTRMTLGLDWERQAVSGAQTTSSPELQRPVGREASTMGMGGAKAMSTQVRLETLDAQQIRMLQTRLRDLGIFTGQVDGTMSEPTRSAIQRYFQSQAELASRGMMTEAVLATFGISSQRQPTSGTAAPPTGAPQRGTATPPSGTSPSRQGGTPPPQAPRGTPPQPPSGSSTPAPMPPSPPVPPEPPAAPRAPSTPPSGTP